MILSAGARLAPSGIQSAGAGCVQIYKARNIGLKQMVTIRCRVPAAGTGV